MSQLSRQIKKIGNYQIGDLLGRGSIGTVYKGLNLELGTLVAIKQVSISSIRKEQHKALQQEINLLKQFRHENIVKYIDCIETEGFLNIILEYIESGSLASIIKKFGSFPESLVAIYVKQVLKGLEYLHAQGVVHRDIKGANILTTKDGIVKLADFGVATSLNEDAKSFSLVGTPYWMAPEVIEMQGHISTSCDIWSLGCTVIELITGNPPYFDLMQYPALFRIVQDDCPPLPEGISEECKDFLIQCFQKDPNLRIDAGRLYHHAWINKNWHIIQNPHMPEEVSNTIKNHIVDQSNFGTFISDSFVEQLPPLVQCQSPRKIDKSSAVRDSQLDSLRQLKLRTSQQAKQPGFWGQNEDGKAMREINELIQQIHQEIEIQLLLKIISNLKELALNDKCKQYLIQNGMVAVLGQIEKVMPKYCANENQAEAVQIIKSIFELINVIVDQSPQLLEQVCHLGALTYFQQVTSQEFHKELRVEAAYFLGQLTYFKEGYLLAAGGLDNLLDFLDSEEVSENLDLIGLAIDTLLLLYEMDTISTKNLSRLLTDKYISFRLVLLADVLQNHDIQYTLKALDVLILLAKCEDKIVKMQLCEKEVITKLVTFLNSTQETVLFKSVKIFRYLSNEPTIQSHFDGFAIIPKALHLLRKELPNQGQMVPDILRIIYYLTKLNLQRQEELALFDGTPLLIELCNQCGEQENQLPMKKVAISVLCTLGSASEKSRLKVQENGGIMIYVNFLKTNLNITKLLDTIVKWIEVETDERIRMSLVKNIDILIQSFRLNTVPMFPTLVKLMPKEFSNSQQFCKTLVELLQVKDQSSYISKQLLQMLIFMLETIKVPREFLKSYNILQFVEQIDQSIHGLALQGVVKQIKDIIYIKKNISNA